MKHLDLFSGIGGFALGLERAGFETVGFCEIEEFPGKVLAKHWPDVPIYKDIRELTGDRLCADGIVPDIITGGFPCTDISVAGKQAGITGERSGLWGELCRIIGEVRPRYALVENVSNLISGDNGRWFHRVLGDLAEIGYDAEWHCISAAHVGAPHIRDRVWILAYPNDQRGHGAWPSRDGRAEPSDSRGLLANACGGRCGRQDQRQDQQPGGAEVVGAGQVVADTKGERRRETRTDSKRSAERPASGGDVLANHPRVGRRPGRARRLDSGSQREPEQALQTLANHAGRWRSNTSTEVSTETSEGAAGRRSRKQPLANTDNTGPQGHGRHAEHTRELVIGPGCWAFEGGGQLEPGFCQLLDGLPQALAPPDRRSAVHCLTCMKLNEVDDGSIAKTGSGEVLQGLRNQNVQEPNEQQARGFGCVPETDLLQSAVHVAGNGEEQPYASGIAEESLEVQGPGVSGLWNRQKAPDASHGPGPQQQQPGELEDVMRLLSYLMALEARETQKENFKGCATLQNLRFGMAEIETGHVPETLSEIQEIWRSSDDETKHWWALRVATGTPFCSEWPGVPRIATGLTERTHRLKGLGNSVVPKIPEMIGRAIMAAERLDL